MKRNFYLSIIALVFVIIIAGCSSDDDTYDIHVSGSTLGGGFYAESSAISDIANSQLDGVRLTVQSTQGGHQNAIEVNETDNAIGISSSFDVYNFTQGKGDFEKKAEDLTAISWGDPAYAQLVVLENSDIHSFSDLEGKVVNPGEKGSGTEATFRPMLDSIGLSYDDFKDVDYLKFSEAADGLKDGVIDAVFWLGTYPASSIEEISTSKDIRLVPLSSEEVQQITDDNSSFSAETIPADSYKGVDEEIETVATIPMLLANKELSEDVIYDLTKLIDENMDELKKGSNTFENWEFDRSLEEIVPLHPGAEKYYDEEGI